MDEGSLDAPDQARHGVRIWDQAGDVVIVYVASGSMRGVPLTVP